MAMEILPLNTFLGRLEILEVFIFFDIPLLFTCKNESNQIYFAVALEDNYPELDWLYSPISQKTAYLLRNGQIDYRDSFLAAENNFVFKVTTIHDKEDSAIPIPLEDLPHDWLPDIGERLLSTCERKLLPYNVEAKSAADHLKRNIVNLVFEFSEKFPLEAPARNLGSIITLCQELVDAIAYKCSPSYKENGRIPNDILIQSDINFAMTFEGSFGIQLRSTATVDSLTFNHSNLAFLKFAHLLTSQGHELKQLLHSLQHRVTNKYCQLFSEIEKTKSDLYFEWSSPLQNKAEVASITHDDLTKRISIAKESTASTRELTVNCRLTGILLRKKKFEIEDIENQSIIYNGIIDDSAMPNASIATIGRLYNATLKQNISTSISTETEKSKWILTLLEEVDG